MCRYPRSILIPPDSVDHTGLLRHYLDAKQHHRLWHPFGTWSAKEEYPLPAVRKRLKTHRVKPTEKLILAGAY